MQYLKIPLGLALKIAIARRGLTNKEFCKFADISESFLSNVLTGQRKAPQRLVEILSAWACYDIERFIKDE